jgi:hypothetical protein
VAADDGGSPVDRIADESAVDGAGVGSHPVPDGAGSHAGTGSRPELREARRQRRRTAWVCAAVVAVCLGLTIAVVTLARYRPPAPPASVVTPVVSPSALPSPVVPPPTVVDRALRPSVPSRGAAAPEGGHP